MGSRNQSLGIVMVGAGVVCGWRVSPLSNLVEIKKSTQMQHAYSAG